MTKSPHKLLAERLNAIPNGYPPTEDGAELRLLEKIFTPEEAALAAQLRLTLETPDEIAARIGGHPKELRQQLKGMSRKGLIRIGRGEHGLAFKLMPFVVGIYEEQLGRMDAELARLFEDYFQQAFGQVLTMEPAIHRVIPVNETIRNDMEVQPFESAVDIINTAKAWGVQDCICRVQKKLIGDPCDHPIDVCMIIYSRPGVFAGHPVIRELTQVEALSTLQRAAEAGLVHSVSNSREGLTYICNCCTCSCGLLRGMAELGLSNVVARSAFVNTVDEDLCAGCEVCIDDCQFEALSMGPEETCIQINAARCVGCGVCVLACPEGALSLVRRPEDEILPVPETHNDWLAERAAARGLDLSEIL
ncbi:MAG: 4Fe-4S binding protein [Chloroflexi bacterium]|nr:4Fe-4S binding protein [Chloroflexota bacterium]